MRTRPGLGCRGIQPSRRPFTEHCYLNNVSRLIRKGSFRIPVLLRSFRPSPPARRQQARAGFPTQRACGGCCGKSSRSPMPCAAEKRCSKRARMAFRSSAQQLGNSLHSFLNARDDAPGQPVSTISGTDLQREGKHWCSTCHGLYHDQSERLRPIDRKKQSGRSTEKLKLALSLISPTNSISVPSRSRGYHLAEEAFIHLEWEACSTRKSNGAVGPFVRRDATDRRQCINQLLTKAADLNHSVRVMSRPRWTQQRRPHVNQSGCEADLTSRFTFCSGRSDRGLA